MEIDRFEEQVKYLETQPVHKRRVLFYGNSYFAFWDNNQLEKMLSKMPMPKPVTVNHGFGGATGAELLYYYPRLVKPYVPKVLVWCEGANDFEQGFSSAEAYANVERVFNKAKHDFSDLKIIIISAIEPPKLIDFPDRIQKKRKYDAKLMSYAENNPHCTFIDIAPFFYEGSEVGNINEFKDIFREDRTHLTEEGYCKFAEFLGTKILKFIKEV